MNPSVMNPVLGLTLNFIGLCVGIAIYIRESIRRKMATQFMAEVMMVGIVAGALIATLVERIVEHTTLPQLFSYTAGGRTIIGGVLGGWIAVEIYKSRFKLQQSSGPLWALAMPAGEFFGRIGCWFNGCCYGKVSSVPWAMYQHGAMRHPTQIYLALASLVTLSVVWRYRDHAQVFWIYLACWSGQRFVIELLREPISHLVWLTPVVCSLVFVASVVKFSAGKSSVEGASAEPT